MENNLYYIGKIDKSIYECICKNISADDVIITEKQYRHILERHKRDYDIIRPFLAESIQNPDYILKDENHKNTGLLLKHIFYKDIKIEIVLRLQTVEEDSGFQNSIISAWRISESRWKNYLKNKIILYKKE